jgi:hypothetical protein
MTDYNADAATSAGTAVTQRSGTASADTLPPGQRVLFFNSGAGAHNIDLAIGYTFDGLAPGSAATPGKRRINITAGQYLFVEIPASYADPTTGRVAVTIDGTAAEVKFWPLAR